ncbi:hypothetical protein LEM8419_00310 [Neolewinella maritima]|uniref:Uncharacterized protein n=1 Tax=Neolewinella maritima TaxID=1383882 RepID=A0ABM9AWC6_9BACT|nr:hypothetical protein [Neolewinella maritima]CAH0999017.1 hypothetical protein LEM8419_00310 [Neolewinella maritima]
MEDIRELLEIASPKKVTKLLKISQTKGKHSVIGELHRLVKRDNLTEQQIVAELYSPTHTPSHPAYRAVKNRLRDLLTTAIMDEDVYSANYKDYDNAQINGFRQLNLINLLLLRRAWHSARYLSHLTLRRVKDFEILPINHRLASILASLYLGVGFDEKQFTKYQTMTDYYAEAERVLNLVSSHYREMRRMMYAHKLLPNEIGEKVGEYVAGCQHLVQQYPQVSALQAMFFIMKVHGMTLLGDYRSAIHTANDAEAVLTKCKGAGKQSLSLMALTRVECSIKLRDFEQGSVQVRRAELMVPANSINHIKLSEYAITLGLQTGNFAYAYAQLAQVDREVLNRLLTQQHVEYWLILEAYVNLLVLAGRIDPEEQQIKLPDFKLAKFVNNVPSYSKDKQGMNIQILIIQVVYFIIKKQYGKIIDRTDALVRYGSRYLMNNENLRNNCFFKLLLTAEKCQFHRAATVRESSKTYKRMTSPQAKRLGRANSTEIIQYENLWEIVLENLDTTLPDGRKLRRRQQA